MCQARARGAAGGTGAVSRLDTALGVVRAVFTARLAPLLLLVFAVVWPLAGFPWWPLVLVLGLAVVLRVLGFGYLIAGKRGPGLLVGLLLVTTLGAWSPWLAVTALGAGVAVAGAFRLPRWQLLAVGMVLFLAAGAGYVAETVIAAQQREASYAQTRAYSHAQLLPRSPRGVLGAVMDSAADADTSAACALFTDAADSFSALHKLPTDKIYHFYLGDPMELTLLHPDGRVEFVVLGQDVLHGQKIQHVVSRDVWQGSRLLPSRLRPGGAYALFGTTMAPGYHHTDYIGGDRDELIAHYPTAAEAIRRLTRPEAPLQIAHPQEAED